jgi:hypothetical protein
MNSVASPSLEGDVQEGWLRMTIETRRTIARAITIVNLTLIYPPKRKYSIYIIIASKPAPVTPKILLVNNPLDGLLCDIISFMLMKTCERKKRANGTLAAR